MTRVGIGFDFHRLVTGRKLVLGGVEIDYVRGLEGYSDADVLIHAICDALLGAAGLEDIGYYFPDTDPQYKDIPSLELLRRVWAKVSDYGFEIENVDTTLLMEAPKISPYRDQMRQRIAMVLDILPSQVAVKATTMEGCGAIGRTEGIAAQAVANLRRRQATLETR
ncbi:MAG: 2-C-methyl-D-erythritol 2,4-cyclodiphosphate synthase [Acidobacteria bacterium]|nr:2-C-methyl-D-erythritol 2,4-cyclodiphosphate synthase [Acidobacteriota bacterium]